MVNYIFSSLTIIISISIYFVFRHQKKDKIFLIILVSLFILSFTGRYFSEVTQLLHTVSLNTSVPFGENNGTRLALSMVLIWLTQACAVMTMLSVFFDKKVNVLKHLVKWYVTLIYLLNFVFMKNQITALYGVDRFLNISFSGTSFAFEIGFGLSIGIIYNIKYFKEHMDSKLILEFFIALITMILCSMPRYALQVFFGTGSTQYLADDFNVLHRACLYGIVIVPILMILSLRNKEYEEKRFALLFFSLTTMLTYSSHAEFRDILDLTSYPFHLCNLAMYMIPVCLIFKANYVYYFTFFINVLGAALAMFMPNLSEYAYIFTEEQVRFWINHYCAFFMPLVIMFLKLYPRPKMKMIKYSSVGFLIYFIIVLIVNSYFSSIGHYTDYFFINSDFVCGKVGADALRDIRLYIDMPWGQMLFFPLYQSLYYLVYNCLTFGMWYVYELLFAIQDSIEDMIDKNKIINEKKKALKLLMNGRNIEEPLFMENSNKLILNHFSKVYSTSNVYAVEDACLEIKGGEVFGFLGPNGAGKSTIIKSMVGIQSITNGEINVCGYDMEKQSVFAKKQIGFVPDHYALYENLTGREYVNYIANLYRVDKKERDERIDMYVKKFHLEGSFENRIKTYSHGMKQKITIISALIHNPKIWILDEPLTGLDPDSIYEVKEAMKEHAKAGNIVFFSSHIIDVVERICDKIAIIKNGHIIAINNLKELEDKGINLENYYKETIDNSNVKRNISIKSLK